jgi:hypothetical protein
VLWHLDLSAICIPVFDTGCLRSADCAFHLDEPGLTPYSLAEVCFSWGLALGSPKACPCTGCMRAN